MFQHITVLFSFVFAIAMTHVLSCVSKLILVRDRVRFSGLHALWMLDALMLLLINWISLWLLETVKHRSVGEIMVQLGWAIPQYFTCSLISMPVGNEEVIDMRAFYERQRPVLFSAFAVTYAMSMVANFADRNNLEGWKPGDWIGAELLVLPMLITALVAGWAKPRWLQWTAAWSALALQSWFLISSYTLVT
jgi:hypothetical protein